MDRTTFLSYLRQPAKLSEISLEDLLRLVDRHPYATDVILLVVLKAKQIGSSDYDRYLSRLAAATFDRPHLFDLLQDIEQQSAAESGGEVLELMQLEELELAPLENPFEELPSRLNESSLSSAMDAADVWVSEPLPRSPAFEVEEDFQEAPPVFTREEEVPDRPAHSPSAGTPFFDSSAWVATAVAYHRALQPVAARSAEPDDPGRFSHLNTLAAIRYDLSSRLLALRDRSEAGTSTRATTAPAAVVSETLADLLVRQGQYGHAVRMYRRLMLLYPEKKPIFAGLIEELKEKK